MGERPTRRSVTRLIKSMRCTIQKAESVRNSMRHRNLASFVRHAANALEAAEWDGARYILMTSLALLATRGVTNGAFPGGATIRQFPVPTGMVVEATMGIVTG